MGSNIEMIAFGPVPSRRLGRSLGINNIPPKICTYACVYCQLGRTIKMQVERQAFYEPEEKDFFSVKGQFLMVSSGLVLICLSIWAFIRLIL